MLSLSVAAGAQTHAYDSGEVAITDGVHVPSPDGSWELVGKGSEILLLDQRTGSTRSVMTISQNTDQVRWSPDSARFFVDDREASNMERTYVYEARTLLHFALGDRIASDIAQFHPQWARYLVPGVNHIYFHAERWIDSGQIEVKLSGHFDGFCVRWGTDDCCRKVYPTREFTMRYAVGVNGTTRLLSGGPEKCRECSGY